MRPVDRRELVGTVDRALKNWGNWRSVNDMQLTWEVYINLYIDRLSPAQRELVRKAKLGIIHDDHEWRWTVDELTTHIWKHLQNMEEI